MSKENHGWPPNLPKPYVKMANAFDRELIFTPSFDINDWIDAYEPAREELEPDHSTERSAP